MYCLYLTSKPCLTLFSVSLSSLSANASANSEDDRLTCGAVATGVSAQTCCIELALGVVVCKHQISLPYRLNVLPIVL